jgi:geranylgeranyl pyrophosphate synthase
MIEFMPSALADALERLDLKLEIPHEIPELQKLLYETVLAGGKRFRPGLCLMMGGILGIPPEKTAPYARVAELMHAATLAHDDVIDEATKRRNRPTLNQMASNQKAVLTGDLLLARVVYEIATLGNLDILREGAQVLEDLVRGEWLQIDRRGVAAPSRHLLEAAARKKTASLIAWCCTTPARLSGASPELLERCRSFGNRVGISFQMADDILDFEKHGEKPYANDLLEGLVNFVVLEMVEKNPSLRQPLQEFLDQTRSAGVVSDSRSMTTPPSAWPWTETELENAKFSVRERIRKLIFEAREDLKAISAMSPIQTEYNSEITESLDQILVLMAERVH